jgi:hypothetical protein
VIEKWCFAAIAFFGAAAGLLVAKYLFGATGVDAAEGLFFGGFVISFGIHVALRLKRDVPKHG